MRGRLLFNALLKDFLERTIFFISNKTLLSMNDYKYMVVILL
jgi:hypothetical protein